MIIHGLKKWIPKTLLQSFVITLLECPSKDSSLKMCYIEILYHVQNYIDSRNLCPIILMDDHFSFGTNSLSIMSIYINRNCYLTPRSERSERSGVRLYTDHFKKFVRSFVPFFLQNHWTDFNQTLHEYSYTPKERFETL